MTGLRSMTLTTAGFARGNLQALLPLAYAALDIARLMLCYTVAMITSLVCSVMRLTSSLVHILCRMPEACVEGLSAELAPTVEHLRAELAGVSCELCFTQDALDNAEELCLIAEDESAMLAQHLAQKSTLLANALAAAQHQQAACLAAQQQVEVLSLLVQQLAVANTASAQRVRQLGQVLVHVANQLQQPQAPREPSATVLMIS